MMGARGLGVLGVLACLATVAAASCDLSGNWISNRRGLTNDILGVASEGGGRYNVSMNIRHGPSVIQAQVFPNNSVAFAFNSRSPSDLSWGVLTPNCSTIVNLTAYGPRWCRAWMKGCEESPPPPYGVGFSFWSTITDNMLLQQAPQKAAVYGILNGGGSKVTVTVTGEGTSYTVDALINATHQPYGPDNATDLGGNFIGPFTSFKAFLKPTPAGASAHQHIYNQREGRREERKKERKRRKEGRKEGRKRKKKDRRKKKKHVAREKLVKERKNGANTKRKT